jgi:2-methylisocitrate lyase-like PEP mutase family enzyme
VRLPWLQAAWLVIAPCFFVPSLMNPDLIAKICQAVDLPINVMFKAVLTACGVARISHSPGPYSVAMADLTARFAAL